MTTYRLVRTGNNNSYTAGGGITINGDTISTNPTEDLVITGDKIGIKPTYVQDNFYVTGTTLVREVADGTKVNLDFTDLINHIDSNIRGLSNPSYGGKSTEIPQGGDINSPEYKTGYYYVNSDELPSNPIPDGYAYYVTKEYYGSMNFKLTATHVGTGRTFVGVSSDMADLVWKELTTEA